METIGLDLFLLSVAWIHVLLAPYTKVEESFNLHAVHDVLMYGIKPHALVQYDHFTFPGAVPRTFIGSVLLGWISTPVIALANNLNLVSTKFDLQIIVRLVLATLNAVGLCYLRRAISRRFNYATSAFFVLLTCSQFHLPFWMGRTLPNMFALLPVNIAAALLIGHSPISATQAKRAHKIAIGLLTFTALVFRAEVALLLAPLVLQTLLTRKLSLFELVKVGVYSSVVSIVLTTCIDSYFWKIYPLWPELHGVYFNVFQGKSAEWGVSPPLTYIKSYLPKLLLGSLPLSLVGSLIDRRILPLLFPSFSFITAISLLGHKEWRFVIYVVPIFNLAAARGASYLCSRKPLFLRRLLILAITAILTANVLVTIVFTLSSVYNYPGGEAMTLLHQLYGRDTGAPHVHISNLAAQTGASLFLHLNARPYPPYLLSGQPYPFAPVWTYNKTEHLDHHAIASSLHFTHLISEDPPSHHPLFKTVGSVFTFERWVYDGDRPWTRKVRMTKSVRLWVLERGVN